MAVDAGCCSGSAKVTFRIDFGAATGAEGVNFRLVPCCAAGAGARAAAELNFRPVCCCCGWAGGGDGGETGLGDGGGAREVFSPAVYKGGGGALISTADLLVISEKVTDQEQQSLFRWHF